MLNYKFSILIGCTGVLIGIFAFLYNYYMVPLSLPGYKLIVAPAIYTLSFFSEETAFIPKMILFLLGQFFGYFSCAFALLLFKKHLNLERDL